MNLIRILAKYAAIAVVALCLSSPVLADDETPETNRGAEFQRVRGPIRESVPGGRLLVIAYGIVWAASFLYVGAQWRRQRKIADDLARLEKQVDAASSSGDAARGPRP